jgi:hypothetical protein
MGFTQLLASAWLVVPAQPVDATPSDINLFIKGGVYDPRETVWAFGGAEEGRVAPLEGRRVVA